MQGEAFRQRRRPQGDHVDFFALAAGRVRTGRAGKVFVMAPYECGSSAAAVLVRLGLSHGEPLDGRTACALHGALHLVGSFRGMRYRWRAFARAGG
jgi:hypothetical protein